jgi:ATP-binding cassette subfamily G (WHITE) protein 2 (PDR)
MYLIPPFTYLVSGVLSIGLTGTEVDCSNIELLAITSPGAELLQLPGSLRDRSP